MSTFSSVSVIVEIRSAEGGDDAKSLVEEQFALYAKRALRDGL
jgi:protein subunit release factor A